MNNVFVYKYSEKVDVNGNAFGPKQNRGWGFCDPRCEYFSVEQNKMTTWDGLNDFLAWYEETLGRPFEVQTEGCPKPGTTTTTTSVSYICTGCTMLQHAQKGFWEIAPSQ